MTRALGRRFLSSDSLSVSAIIMAIMLVVLVFRPNYLGRDNLLSLTRVFSVTAVIGLSQMIVMSTGGMNIAVGEVGGLCAVLTGVFMGWMGMDPVLAVALVLVTGALCGAVNGFFTLRCGGVGVASFLATLATGSAFAGATLSITRAKPIYKMAAGFLSLGERAVAGVPLMLLVMVAIAALVSVFFRSLKTGRQLLALGGNARAAELYGVSRTRVIIAAHVMSCVLAALAGLMTVVRIQAAQTNIGSDWMLMSMAAPLLGGTRATGGKVNSLGTILGAVVLTLIANGLVQFKVDVYWNDLINGLVILAVAGMNRARALSARRA